MRYPLTLEGFDGTPIEIEPSGIFKSARVLIHGAVAPKGKGKGEFILNSSTGLQKVVQLKRVFLDPVPAVHVDGRVIQLAQPLAWYQWLWSMWPLGLLFVGGALGGFLGALAAIINIKIIRSKSSAALRYAGSLVVSVVAIVIFIVVAGAFSVAVGR